MPKMISKNQSMIAVAVSLSLGLTACNSDDDNTQATPVTVELRLLETSDLHANVMDYDYYKTQVDSKIGLARTASLIEAAGKEATNFVLVDNGDLIQGSPMGDYMAKKGLVAGDVHPVYKAMNTLGYSVGNIGNHEFNYGLDYLEHAMAGANFPYINANVICQSDCWGDKTAGENLFTPYIIEEKTVLDSNGDQQTVKIGYIGFVPPQILLWDKQNLTDRVIVADIVKTAEKFVPMMKAEGADVIVAIPHSGIGSTSKPADPMAENATYALTNVEGIDAIMFGHSHSVFPHARYADLPNTDVEKGTLNNVAAVMPGRWGDNLGVIDLTLEMTDGKWTITDTKAESRPIYDGANKVELVDASPAIHDAVATEHQATLDFVNQPIGVASADMYSFLTLVQDDPSVQIVSNAQIDHVKRNMPTELANLPVLSASAPFKAGGRHSTTADAESYVQVPAGDLTFKNAADLYLYPNTMVALKVTGKEVADWLECSANQFNQIDASSTAPQYLVNWETHRTYNFDVIDGVNYKVDVTQPSKFDGDCVVVNENAQRIVELSYTDEHGNVFTGDELATKEFIIASNNYRAFGGKFAGTGSDYVVMELPDTNREALAAYITRQSQANTAGGYDSVVDPSADFNWDFKTITTGTALDIRFETSNSAEADTFIQNNMHRPMTKLADADALGFAVYQIDLTK